MKLYYSPGACSLAAHIVAVEGGLTLTLEKVNLKTHVTESGDDFSQLNPKGYVPALRLEDDTLLTENAAILPFLGEKAGLMPDGMGFYRVLEWIGFINSEIHKSFAPLFQGGSEDDIAKAKKKIRARLKLAEDALHGEYLMGGRFTPSDAYLFVMLRWCEKHGVDLSGLPRLAAFKTRMKSRPAVSRALTEEGLAPAMA